MADVLGITSGIIAVLGLAAKVSTLSYGYFSGVKRAPKDLQELLGELNSLIKLLTALQGHIQTNSSSLTLQTFDLIGSLNGCLRELETLRIELKPKTGILGRIGNFTWPFKEINIAQSILRIERHKSLITLALQADQMALAKDIKGCQEESAEWRRKEDMHRLDEKRDRVLNWLFAGDFRKKHLEITDRRQENTGGWVLRNPRFREWVRKNANSPLLWGFGIPGAGKTFLASVVIDHLQDQTKDCGVAYIYFDYKEKDQQRPIHVLASLVRQLAAQIASLPIEIEQLHDKLQPKGKRPEFQDLHTILLATFKYFSGGQVFLIFDALDECDQDSKRTGQKGLLELFHSLARGGANLFVTSRQYPEDIQESFRNVSKIELSAQSEDIAIYIQQKINDDPKARRLVLQANCQDMIISELTACAQGMFLLVGFHVKYLCQQTTAGQILAALNRLKSSSTTERPMSPTYDRVMKALRDQSESCAELGIKVLSWLVKAQRTLTVDELRTAVSIEPDRYGLDGVDLLDKATILDVCAGLVTIDEKSDIIRLAHYTVQEYLLENCIVTEDAELMLAMGCTTYLSFDIFTQGACKDQESLEARLKSNPFLDYAVHQLPHHLRACDENLSTDMVLGFLRNPGSISSWIQIWYHDHSENGACSNFQRYPRKCRALHIATALGHLKVTRLLLERGAKISFRDSYGKTALHNAVLGRGAVVQLLFEKGVDISARDINGQTALHHAAHNGNEVAVQILIQNGANVSAIDRKGETSLHSAAWGGFDGVVRLLLEKGSNLSALNDQRQTALHIAADLGYETVVSLLLEKGASTDISVPDKRGDTPLQLAAWGGSVAVVRLLLEKYVSSPGREVDLQTALCGAASEGHRPVVKFLLETGAKISAPDPSGDTALHHAAWGGHNAVVLLLLQNLERFELSASNSSGDTALHYAANQKQDEVVRLLLDSGSEISVQNSDGLTALHLAARSGHEGMVRLLLEKSTGIDLSIRDKSGYTALLWAVSEGHEEVVRPLLEKGADHSARDNDGSTVLHLAVREGYEDMVRFLLEKGGDHSAQDNNGSTPLHLVLRKGDKYGRMARHLPLTAKDQKITQLLLEGGVDHSKREKNGSTALHLAVRKGDEDMVRLLLEKGAEYSARDNDGSTVLHLAVREGYEDMVRFLLEKGTDHSAQDNNGSTALHLVLRKGGEDIVRLLLEKGADHSAQDKYGRIAQHLPLTAKDQKIAQLLLEGGVDHSKREKNGSTALHLAVRKGDEDMVRLLLEKGADHSAQDKDGHTALYLALTAKDMKIIQLLVEGRADHSIRVANGSTALHQAVWWSDGDMVQLLLEKGADHSAQDQYGRTALHLALTRGGQMVTRLLVEEGADHSIRVDNGFTALHIVIWGDEDMVRLLLEKGADHSARDHDGSTTLHLAVCWGDEDISRLLLEKGADHSTHYGSTALQPVASTGGVGIFRFLLKKAAETSIKDNSGHTALSLAEDSGLSEPFPSLSLLPLDPEETT